MRINKIKGGAGGNVENSPAPELDPKALNLDLDADAPSLTRCMELVGEFASLRHRTCLEVCEALLATRTLASLGYVQGGHMTQRQCNAAIAILEGWIRRVRVDQQGTHNGQRDPRSRA
jgi:hypothetical protein